MSIVAVHQPNYIPWPGYFHKIAACDIFVYLDGVQLMRGRSFATRNRIKTANGIIYLTIPVSRPRGREGKVTYLEAAFADPRWPLKHLRTIEHAYRRAPYFEPVYDLYREQILRASSLVGVNIALIETFCSYLGIDTPRVRVSELLEAFGQKTRLIIDVCKALGAQTYLSGSGGGRSYNDEALLYDHGIELRYDSYPTPAYDQLWGPFVPRLSILDLLFNRGPQCRELVTGA